MLEAYGAAVYERSVAHTMPKRAHLADLLQLVYLAGAKRRMIVTDDRSMLRVAHEVLGGRYNNAWAIHIADLLR
jgi:IS4 transposase